MPHLPSWSTARTLLVFAGFVYLADAAVVISPLFVRVHLPFSIAVVLDYALVVPLMYFLFGANRGRVGRPPLFMALSGLMIASSLLVARGSPLSPLLVPIRQLGWIVAELMLVVALWLTWGTWKRSSDTALDTDERLAVTLESLISMNWPARFLATEMSVARHAICSIVPPPLHFRQRSGTAWTLCGLAFAGLIELIPVHLAFKHFRLPGFAWSFTVLGLYTSLWLYGLFRAERGRASSLDAHTLRLRIGLRWRADIPIALIRSLEIEPRTLPQPNGAYLGTSFELRPNVLLELHEPLEFEGLFGSKRRARLIGLNLEEPERFKTQLESALHRISPQAL